MKVKTLRLSVVVLSAILIILLGIAVLLPLQPNEPAGNDSAPLLGWQQIDGKLIISTLRQD